MAAQNGERVFSSTSKDHIGVLYERDSKPGASQTIDVYANQEIIIGRDPKTCQYTIDNPTVSNKHLRIYTVVFDQENPGEVAPLVYAQDLSRHGTFWNGHRAWKHNGGVLLSDGDVLRITAGVEFEFRCAKEDKSFQPFDWIRQKEMKGFGEEYLVTKRKLGSGAYGQVHMAIERKTAQQLACKIIDVRAIRKRTRCSGPARSADVDPKAELIKIKKWGEKLRKKTYIEQKAKFCQREAEILEKIQHPNIIGLERVVKTKHTIYLFQDLVTAGDLFSFLEFKQGKLPDIEAAVIVRQVLIALDYLHDQNIVHRDLKPDNILMTSFSTGSRVVLTDFGCARIVNSERKRMSSVMGTLEYTAPEITRANNASTRGYTKAVDLWSLGCVAVVLLTGGSPFTDPITNMYSQKLAHECDLEKLELDEDWMNVGERAKDFVRQLLVLDEDKRMTAKQALMHEWFTNPSHKEEFENVYNRAVQDWKPRVRRTPILSDFSEDGKGRRPSPRPILRPMKETPVEFPYKPSPQTMIRMLNPKTKPTTLNKPVLSPEKMPPPPPRPPYSKRKRCEDQTEPSPPVRTKHSISIAALCTHDVSWDNKQPDVNKAKKRKTTPNVSNGEREHLKLKSLLSLPTPKSENTKHSKGEPGFRVRRPFSPKAWDRISDISKPPPKFPDLRNGLQSNHEAKRKSREDKVNIPKYPIGTKPNGDSPASNGSLKRPRKPENTTPNGKKTGNGDDVFDFEEDQVFEEVDEGISGKRRRVAYGEGLDSEGLRNGESEKKSDEKQE